MVKSIIIESLAPNFAFDIYIPVAAKCLAASILFMVITCLLAEMGRRLIKHTDYSQFVKNLFNEAIASAELCGCCFELIVVADNFGVAMYAIFLFVLTIWWSRVWEDAAACPYIHVETYLQGGMEIRTVVLLTWAELMGGVLVYRYVQFIWRMGLVESHKDIAYQDCSADLQVNMFFGAIIECISTCLCRVVSKAITDLQPKHGNLFDSFFGTTLVVLAFNYSGGYFNPVLATSLKYNCEGNTFIEHIVVYWIGSIFGSVLSITAYNSKIVQKYVFGEGGKPKPIEKEF